VRSIASGFPRSSALQSGDNQKSDVSALLTNAPQGHIIFALRQKQRSACQSFSAHLASTLSDRPIIFPLQDILDLRMLHVLGDRFFKPFSVKYKYTFHEIYLSTLLPIQMLCRLVHSHPDGFQVASNSWLSKALITEAEVSFRLQQSFSPSQLDLWPPEIPFALRQRQLKAKGDIRVRTPRIVLHVSTRNSLSGCKALRKRR
jgi:hypothetical protein